MPSRTEHAAQETPPSMPRVKRCLWSLLASASSWFSRTGYFTNLGQAGSNVPGVPPHSINLLLVMPLQLLARLSSWPSWSWYWLKVSLLPAAMHTAVASNNNI